MPWRCVTCVAIATWHTGRASPKPHLDQKLYRDPARAVGALARTALALLGSLREEFRRLVLYGLTAALQAAQVSSFMLSDVFDMLENLAALHTTISVRRHGASPP